MKALLKAIKNVILADTDFNYLDSRVYISLETSTEIFFSPSFSCPSIVISPGAYDINWLPDNTTDETKFVQVSSYLYLREIEDSLFGVDGQKGVIEISDQARVLLVHNDLGLNYDEVEVRRVERPDPFYLKSQKENVIRQSMTLIYSKFQ